MSVTRTAVSFRPVAKELFSFMNIVKAVFVLECCQGKCFLTENVDLEIGTQIYMKHFVYVVQEDCVS